MTKLALLIPLLVLVGSAGAAQADGCPPSSCGTFASAEPGSPYLIVRSNGQSGPIGLYRVADGKQQLSLPRGLLSADGRTFLVARPLGQQATLVTRFALPSAQVRTRVKLRGRHWAAAISADGRRTVLGTLAPRHSTRLEVLDGTRISKVVALKGSYELETISPDGNRLFLIHWRNNGYDLRRYDLRTGRMTPTPTRSAESGGLEKMQGNAWTAVASRDGAWLLTLYLKGDGTAFIHALDLRAGVGHCIDLPVAPGDFNAAGTAALTLSPNQRRLYVTMPLVGRIFTLDLRKLDLTRTVRFRPVPVNGYSFGINPSAALTKNGRMLYVAAGPRLWAVDTAVGRVRGPYAIGKAAMGTAVSPDGRRVVVLRIDRELVVRDAATLRRIR
jgi:hypothetical protein